MCPFGLLPTCRCQLHKTKVSERLKVDKIIIYINVKPIMPKGFHIFLQTTVISKPSEENVTVALTTFRTVYSNGGKSKWLSLDLGEITCKIITYVETTRTQDF